MNSGDGWFHANQIPPNEGKRNDRYNGNRRQTEANTQTHTKSLAVSAPGGKELDEDQVLAVDGGGKVLLGEVQDVRVLGSLDAGEKGGGSEADKSESRGETHCCVGRWVEKGG